MVGTKTSKTVTVQHRGTFSDDPFFKDSWKEWDQAMKNVVDKWDQSGSTTSTSTTTTTSSAMQPKTETRNVYRQIRSSNVTSEDSQAVSCTEEDDKYKMMIDVKDYKPEHISVKTVDDTVVVEGKIEKKEGNAVSTQVFTRRFLLPPVVDMNKVSSALSRDGVLTISATKLASHHGSGKRSVPISGHSSGGRAPTIISDKYRINPASLPAAGMPTRRDGDDRRYVDHTPMQPDGSRTITTTSTQLRDDGHWNSFNQMVEKSQKEMEDMMRRHSLKSDMDDPASPPRLTSNVEMSVPSTALARPPVGVSTSRDVITSGNNVTQREEQRWQDQPAPGLNRTNRVLNEKTELKGSDGSVVGNKKRSEQESHAEGSNEEVLPDGTKKRTFTKNYETRKVYSFNTTDPKTV